MNVALENINQNYYRGEYSCTTLGVFTRSIDQSTFNVRHCYVEIFPKDVRDTIYTALKLNNLVFNILGYVPGIAIVSGTIRMLIGIGILATVLSIGDPKAITGPIIGRFYWEAVNTGLAQIARGALEAVIPAGNIVNIALDVIGTLINPINSTTWDLETYCAVGAHEEHEAPTYPLLLKPLHIV